MSDEVTTRRLNSDGTLGRAVAHSAKKQEFKLPPLPHSSSGGGVDFWGSSAAEGDGIGARAGSGVSNLRFPKPLAASTPQRRVGALATGGASPAKPSGGSSFRRKDPVALPPISGVSTISQSAADPEVQEKIKRANELALKLTSQNSSQLPFSDPKNNRNSFVDEDALEISELLSDVDIENDTNVSQEARNIAAFVRMGQVVNELEVSRIESGRDFTFFQGNKEEEVFDSEIAGSDGSDVVELSHRLEVVEEELRIANATISRLRGLEEDNSKLLDESDVLRKGASEMRALVRQSSLRRRALEQGMAELDRSHRNEIDAVKREAEKSAKALEEKHLESLQDLQLALDSAREDVDRIGLENEGLVEKVDILQSQLGQLTELYGKKEKSLIEDNTNLRSETEVWRAQVWQLESRLGDFEVQARLVSELKGQIDELQSKLESNSAGVSAPDPDAPQVAEWKKRVAELEERMAHYQASLEAFNKVVAGFEAAAEVVVFEKDLPNSEDNIVTALSKLRSRVGGLNSKYGNLKTELLGAKSQLERGKLELDALKEQLRENNRRIDDLQQELHKVNSENIEVMGLLKGALEENERLKKSIQELEVKNENLEKRILEEEEKNRKLAENLARLTTESDAVRRDLKGERLKVAELSSRLRLAQEESGEKDAVLAKQEQALKDQRSALEAALVEKARLENEKQELQAALAKAAKDNEGLKADVAAKDLAASKQGREIEGLKAANASLQDEARRANLRAAQLQAQIDASGKAADEQTRLANKQRDLANARADKAEQDLVAANAANAALVARLAALEEQNERLKRDAANKVDREEYDGIVADLKAAKEINKDLLDENAQEKLKNKGLLQQQEKLEKDFSAISRFIGQVYAREKGRPEFGKGAEDAKREFEAKVVQFHEDMRKLLGEIDAVGPDAVAASSEVNTNYGIAVDLDASADKDSAKRGFFSSLFKAPPVVAAKTTPKPPHISSVVTTSAKGGGAAAVAEASSEARKSELQRKAIERMQQMMDEVAKHAQFLQTKSDVDLPAAKADYKSEELIKILNNLDLRFADLHERGDGLNSRLQYANEQLAAKRTYETIREVFEKGDVDQNRLKFLFDALKTLREIGIDGVEKYGGGEDPVTRFGFKTSSGVVAVEHFTGREGGLDYEIVLADEKRVVEGKLDRANAVLAMEKFVLNKMQLLRDRAMPQDKRASLRMPSAPVAKKSKEPVEMRRRDAEAARDPEIRFSKIKLDILEEDRSGFDRALSSAAQIVFRNDKAAGDESKKQKALIQNLLQAIKQSEDSGVSLNDLIYREGIELGMKYNDKGMLMNPLGNLLIKDGKLDVSKLEEIKRKKPDLAESADKLQSVLQFKAGVVGYKINEDREVIDLIKSIAASVSSHNASVVTFGGLHGILAIGLCLGGKQGVLDKSLKDGEWNRGQNKAKSHHIVAASGEGTKKMRYFYEDFLGSDDRSAVKENVALKAIVADAVAAIARFGADKFKALVDGGRGVEGRDVDRSDMSRPGGSPFGVGGRGSDASSVSGVSLTSRSSGFGRGAGGGGRDRGGSGVPSVVGGDRPF